MMKKRVLILCTGNSARSQMAEGLLRDMSGDKFEVSSGGVEPTHVRSEAVDVMQEVGIDISAHRSKSADEFLHKAFDYIITVCDNARDKCPFFTGNAKRIHWSFMDPAAVGEASLRLKAFRRVRDEIRTKLIEFTNNA
jgi:arsenate reductase (thioredoxin)